MIFNIKNNFLDKIISAGAYENISSHEMFRLRSLNSLCFACSFIPFVYIALLWNSDVYYLNYFFLFFQFLFFLSIVFNFYHHFNYSKLILVLTTSVSVSVVSIFTGFESGFHLYIYNAPFYVFLLFNLKELKLIFVSIAIYILAYIVIFINRIYFKPIYHFEAEFLTQTLYPVNLLMNFFLLLFLFYSYTKFYYLLEKNLLEKQTKLEDENKMRIESEQKTKKLFNDLTQSYKNLEQFNFIVSHNLRAPLSNIIGLSQIIDKNELSTDNKEIIEGIALSAENLDSIFADLNNILKLKTKIIEQKTIINLGDTVEYVLNSLNVDLNEVNDFTILYNKESEILTEKTLFTGIIANLIQNSIKYRRKNVTLNIEINLEKQNDVYELKIKDNGIGIDIERYKDRLFTLYGKFNRETSGKGLGLYMVKVYTELLNGSVAVNSKTNEFTEFVVIVK